MPVWDQPAAIIAVEAIWHALAGTEYREGHEQTERDAKAAD